MAYKSPVEIIQEEARMHYEDAVVKAIQPYLITVNKEELMEAMKYDRAQYDKGYADGRADALNDLVRCKDCKHHEDEEPRMVYCPNIVGSWVNEDFFCGYGKRKNDSDNE